MWAWLGFGKHLAGKFSVTAMLREQLALSEARVTKLESDNAELKAKIAVLEAQLNLTQQAHQKLEKEYGDFKEEHKEVVVVWGGIEFRRGSWASLDFVVTPSGGFG